MYTVQIEDLGDSRTGRYGGFPCGGQYLSTHKAQRMSCLPVDCESRLRGEGMDGRAWKNVEVSLGMAFSRIWVSSTSHTLAQDLHKRIS